MRKTTSPAADEIPKGLIESFALHLEERLGWSFPPSRRSDLLRKAEATAIALGYSDAETFIRHMTARQWTREEIQSLSEFFTVGETWFYRNKEDFDNLRDDVLPDIIERRRVAGRHLRVWSAACCTGEEPYSLATYLDECIPNARDWRISILATDINSTFLRRARAGIYREWSFRTTPNYLRDRYFSRTDDGRFLLAERIREMVDFSYLNLVSDHYPSSRAGLDEVDIIFLRNVLIYFSEEQIGRVLERMHKTLAFDGVLIVSACEAPFCDPNLFRQLSESSVSIFHKAAPPKKVAEPRKAAGIRAHAKKGNSKPRPDRDRRTSVPHSARRTQSGIAATESSRSEGAGDESDYNAAKGMFADGNYRQAAALLEDFIRQAGAGEHGEDAYRLLIEAKVNLGDLDAALRISAEATGKYKLAKRLYYLKALVHQAAGENIRATEILRKAIYIDPDYVMAHFMLAHLELNMSRPGFAAKHLETSLKLLQNMDLNDIVEGSEGLTVGRMREMVDRLIAREGGEK